MQIQSGTFTVTGSNYAQMNKEATANKAGEQNTGGISLAANSQFNKMIENIREQIQKIQENDKLDAEAKKSKIEELEKQLMEIEKARAEKLGETLLDSKKKLENNKDEKSSNNINDSLNGNGVLVDISFDAKALLEADNNLKHLKNANSTKVQLEGESNVLASEIKIDKSRGVDTTKKEEQLAKIQEGIEKSMNNISETMKDINNTVKDISADKKQDSDTANESHVEDSKQPSEASSAVTENNTTEKADAGEKINK